MPELGSKVSFFSRVTQIPMEHTEEFFKLAVSKTGLNPSTNLPQVILTMRRLYALHKEEQERLEKRDASQV